MLAIADFVPGDVDKEQMIADYVNDQIDVVSKAFLGLSIACARCHDHKFDPISTEDYYALAGIFFSTRLIPGPVPGNTPLVRVPLLSKDELTKIEAQDTALKRRRAELEQQLPDAADRAYVALLPQLLGRETARYLVTASEFRQGIAGQVKPSLVEVARQRGLHSGLLAGFVDYLGRVAGQPSIRRHPIVCDIASGKLVGSTLEKSAMKLQEDLAALAARKQAESTRSPRDHALADSCLIRIRADDPQLVTDTERPGYPLAEPLWPTRGRPAGRHGTRSREDQHHDQRAHQDRAQVRRPVPAGTPAPGAPEWHHVGRLPNRRLIPTQPAPARLGRFGHWQTRTRADARAWRSLARDPAEQRSSGRPGRHTPDRGSSRSSASPGDRGARLCIGTGRQPVPIKGSIRFPPTRPSWRCGWADPVPGAAPGSGAISRRFRSTTGNWTRPSDSWWKPRLRAAWFDPAGPKEPHRDPLTDLYEELLSARGPFWLAGEERRKMLPLEERSRLDELSRELEVLKKTAPIDIPRAVVVQDGGPKGTRHEGFKDSQVFLRGNPKKLGKTVPRGVPSILVSDRAPRVQVTEGSGRLQLAAWLARVDNPLTARVMVNRIWQHHFGEGLVRTPNDFGERGERPTNPGLLDFLAMRFVESGWSVKTLHRIIMLSSTYQQSSRAGADASGQGPGKPSLRTNAPPAPGGGSDPR